MNKRAKGTIEGIVQGVGFRPFIYQLAGRYHLTGYVSNTSAGVDLEVEGPLEQIQAFQQAIPSESPPLAHISAVTWEEISPERDKHFSIITSKAGSERTALISPDVCICSQCFTEMMDPLDRRYRYPFINCTNCGPRYTIIEDVPYDRAVTTMKSFSMCSVCSEEYSNPNSRRFHAQPNACWDCGPVTALHKNSGESISCDDPVRKATELLTKGHILAIKGLGGFHLAVDAANHKAVVRLRKRKHREEKPLAIMVKDLETALKIAHVNRSEAVLLTSRQRPIVLLKK
ncbi:MAG: acylphosphatase, partial [Desulfobulbaceae bacterium]|nr:acylphosphatase [Desulfobulbaceae bacterium]